jgi:TonB-dependent SusC/RagA subfamily outer membrane receptor
MRTATPAADGAPKTRIRSTELPSVVGDAAGSGVRVRADSGPRPAPIFIVDGQEVEIPLGPTGVLDFPIPPDSIASVEVVKGAAATKLYGARGAHGVVVITTKGRG